MPHSIKTINKIYETCDKPVLVECSDLNDYIFKNNRGQSALNKLFGMDYPLFFNSFGRNCCKK